MSRIRRTAYLYFYFQDGKFLDPAPLLRGQVKLLNLRHIYAISLVAGNENPITAQQLEILLQIPSHEWILKRKVVEQLKADPSLIDDLLRKGLILSKEKDEYLCKLRSRDEKLTATKWNIHAALYHFMSKWKGMDADLQMPRTMAEQGDSILVMEKLLEEFIRKHGLPPGHFHTASRALSVRRLPPGQRAGPLYQILRRRQTTRAFDTRTSMKVEELSTLLYYVYGCHGYTRVGQLVGLKKTSPSGGDLHPTEVYPLIMHVKGIQCGLYHYNVRDHALELLRSLNLNHAQRWADEFTAGQDFPRKAHALFIMTARFYRNFWKYQRHQRAYTVLLMDAAHLSQTFYLVCTELGLGAFFTAAINAVDIEEKLGLDGYDEGAMGICGCGYPSKQLRLDPEFKPYVPGRTKI